MFTVCASLYIKGFICVLLCIIYIALLFIPVAWAQCTHLSWHRKFFYYQRHSHAHKQLYSKTF